MTSCFSKLNSLGVNWNDWWHLTFRRFVNFLIIFSYMKLELRVSRNNIVTLFQCFHQIKIINSSTSMHFFEPIICSTVEPLHSKTRVKWEMSYHQINNVPTSRVFSAFNLMTGLKMCTVICIRYLTNNTKFALGRISDLKIRDNRIVHKVGMCMIKLKSF